MTDNDLSRRRFLQATGGAATAAAIAGCTEGGETTTEGGGQATDTPGTSTGTPTPEPIDFNGWPYGYGESQIEEAQRVMEEAGYGEDERYELSWLQYTSESWSQMAQTIRDRLSNAYIDMTIEEADFSTLLERTANGNMEAFTLGWIADYPAPDNFLQLVNPPNTDFTQDDATGARVFWTADTQATELGESQWGRVENNQGPTQDQQEIRNEAYVRMEEAIWAGLPIIPMFHGAAEPMWYDYVDYPVHGSMGRSRQMYNTVSVEGDDTLNLTNAAMTTFDPIASVGTASGEVIQQMFDGLTNYPDGEAAVEQLLATDFETSDDFTTYTFSLKEGATYHDGSEFTADDMVYSWRRLAESENSRRRSFILGFLGVTHETDDDGNIVPDTLGVEAVDDYTFEVTLESPFASALSLMAYSSFSAVPEGVVGDIEGYDGEMDQSEFATSNPVGCGPFSFDHWDQGSEAQVNAYADYHGEAPSVDAVHWATIEDDTAAYNYFMNQNADRSGIPSGQYDSDLVSIEDTDDLGREIGTYGPVRNGETLNYAKVPEVSTYYLGFNTEEVPFAVRQAVAYVVDQEQFNQNIFKGRQFPAYHLTPPLIYPGGGNAYTDHAEPQ